MNKNRYVIIGCSAAGIAAADSIRKHDSISIIRMVSDESYPPYARIFLPKIITGEVSPSEIQIKSNKQIERLQIELIHDTKVININTADKTIVLKNNLKIEYDKLLIAAGASPKMPEINGIALPGIFGLRTIQDAEKIHQRVKHCKQVVIIGGGLVSLKAAEALSHFDLDIHIIVRSQQILSQMLDFRSANVILSKVQEYGIKVHFSSDVVEISGNDEVESVILSNGEKIPCQMVIIGKGVTPNLSFIEGSGIKTNNGILVDKQQHTNKPDIYAAGDIALTPDFFKREHSIKALWPNAVQQGKIAGHNMTGRETENPGEINANILNLFGLDLASCGQLKTLNEDYHEMTFQNNSCFRRIVFHQDVLVGAVLVGDVRSIGVLRAIILSKRKVFHKKDLLIDKNFKFTSMLESIHF